jgi:hypothetical protein
MGLMPPCQAALQTRRQWLTGIAASMAPLTITRTCRGGEEIAQRTPVRSANASSLQMINGASPVVRIDRYTGRRARQWEEIVTLPPGAGELIPANSGMVFRLVNPRDFSETRVTARFPVQTFHYPSSLLRLPDDQVLPVPQNQGIPPFYQQCISAHGLLILGSLKVSPYALKEAAWLVNRMLSFRDDLRNVLIASGARLCVMAHNEFTTDLPEFAHLEPPKGFEAVAPRDYWDARTRGLGGSAASPFGTCAEENLLGYPGDPYAAECTLIHEFAHCIQARGMANIDPTFENRLCEIYGEAMKKGLWRGKYASENPAEYFAEGVQSWFGNNRQNDLNHNHVNTRKELLAYDPALAALCREVFGETAINYTLPITRLHGHLEGYEPAKAPVFRWPERLVEAHHAIASAARQRALAPYLTAPPSASKEEK